MATQEEEREHRDGSASEKKAPIKFSFTASKPSSSSRPPLFPKQDDPNAADVEFVSVFDGKGIGPAQAAAVKVIPLPQHSWRPERRMKNIMSASENLSTATTDMFEMETLEAGPQPFVKYGLQLKRKSPDSAETGPPEMAADSDLRRLREDVAVLPDESSVDDYENVPVEDFSKALIRGMGWEEGKPIGRRSTKVVQPFEAVRRDGRLALGAIPAPKHEKSKKFIKPGESRKTKLTVGRIMCIVAGKDAGYRGQIADFNGNHYTVVLLESRKRLQVKEGDLAEVGSIEEENAMKKLAAFDIDHNNGADENIRGSSDDGKRKHGAVKGEGQDEQLSSDARYDSDKKSSASDEGAKSKHGRSQAREDPDHGKESRRTSHEDSRHKKDSSERGKRDRRTTESRHRKHSSRSYDDHDEKEEHRESASRRHGKHGHERKSSSIKIRQGENALDRSRFSEASQKL